MASKKGKEEKASLKATLIGIGNDPYEERITIPFPLADIQALKIGQEIKVTISGCVKHLDGDDHYSSVGLEIYEKSFRKTSNTQAEGIRDLSEDEDY
jgi:hypothetical protein